jgi:hypothetical protein
MANISTKKILLTINFFLFSISMIPLFPLQTACPLKNGQPQPTEYYSLKNSRIANGVSCVSSKRMYQYVGDTSII